MARGELVAANIEKFDLDFGMEAIAASLGWETAFLRFADARSSLVKAMQEEQIDSELIDLVKLTKCQYVPVQEG